MNPNSSYIQILILCLLALIMVNEDMFWHVIRIQELSELKYQLDYVCCVCTNYEKTGLKF